MITICSSRYFRSLKSLVATMTILAMIVPSGLVGVTYAQGQGLQPSGNYVWQMVESGQLAGATDPRQFEGYEFIPGKDGFITELCGFFQGTHGVDLYDSSFNILASITVSSYEQWNCAVISPVSVKKQSQYYVVGEIFSGSAFKQSVSLPQTSGDVSLVSGVTQPVTAAFGQNIKSDTNYVFGLVDVKFSSDSKDALLLRQAGSSLAQSVNQTSPAAVTNNSDTAKTGGDVSLFKNCASGKCIVCGLNGCQIADDPVSQAQAAPTFIQTCASGSCYSCTNGDCAKTDAVGIVKTGYSYKNCSQNKCLTCVNGDCFTTGGSIPKYAYQFDDAMKNFMDEDHTFADWAAYFGMVGIDVGGGGAMNYSAFMGIIASLNENSSQSGLWGSKDGNYSLRIPSLPGPAAVTANITGTAVQAIFNAYGSNANKLSLGANVISMYNQNLAKSMATTAIGFGVAQTDLAQAYYNQLEQNKPTSKDNSATSKQPSTSTGQKPLDLNENSAVIMGLLNIGISNGQVITDANKAPIQLTSPLSNIPGTSASKQTNSVAQTITSALQDVNTKPSDLNGWGQYTINGFGSKTANAPGQTSPGTYKDVTSQVANSGAFARTGLTPGSTDSQPVIDANTGKVVGAQKVTVPASGTVSAMFVSSTPLINASLKPLAVTVPTTSFDAVQKQAQSAAGQTSNQQTTQKPAAVQGSEQVAGLAGGNVSLTNSGSVNTITDVKGYIDSNWGPGSYDKFVKAATLDAANTVNTGNSAVLLTKDQISKYVGNQPLPTSSLSTDNSAVGKTVQSNQQVDKTGNITPGGQTTGAQSNNAVIANAVANWNGQSQTITLPDGSTYEMVGQTGPTTAQEMQMMGATDKNGAPWVSSNPNLAACDSVFYGSSTTPAAEFSDSGGSGGGGGGGGGASGLADVIDTPVIKSCIAQAVDATGGVIKVSAVTKTDATCTYSINGAAGKPLTSGSSQNYSDNVPASSFNAGANTIKVSCQSGTKTDTCSATYNSANSTVNGAVTSVLGATFKFKDANGQVYSITDYSGAKIVVNNYTVNSTKFKFTVLDTSLKITGVISGSTVTPTQIEVTRDPVKVTCPVDDVCVAGDNASQTTIDYANNGTICPPGWACIPKGNTGVIGVGGPVSQKSLEMRFASLTLKDAVSGSSASLISALDKNEPQNLAIDSAPQIVNYQPRVSDGKDVTITLQTDSPSTCRFSPYDLPWVFMWNKMDTKDGLTHSYHVGAADPGTYMYYAQCQSDQGVSSNNYTFMYSVDKNYDPRVETDKTPPAVANVAVSKPSLAQGTPEGITAKVGDNVGVGNVLAQIKDPKGQYLAVLGLTANSQDGTFGYQWDTTSRPAGQYQVTIEADDLSGNFSRVNDTASFTVTSNSQTSGITIGGQNNNADICKSLQNSGDPAAKLDVVFVPCGFGSDMASFEMAAQSAADKMLSVAPLADNKQKFNITLAEDPGLTCADTLSSNMDNDAVRFREVALPCNPDAVIVLKKGGDDGGISLPGSRIAFMLASDPFLAAHELGHAFFRLNDEYSYGCTAADLSTSFNCDDGPKCTKWKDVAGAKCIAGCTCEGNYRSSADSVMFDSRTATSFSPAAAQHILDWLTAFK